MVDAINKDATSPGPLLGSSVANGPVFGVAAGVPLVWGDVG